MVGSLCSADPPLRVADRSSFGIGNRAACNRTIARHVWPSDPKEETPLGISKEEDCGRLSLQGRPKTHGNMLCESPNLVKYDWPGKPEHSGLGCVGVPEDQEAMRISTCRMEHQHGGMLREAKSQFCSAGK